jgi:hypothetical protein
VGKRLGVLDGIFTVTDTVDNRLEFQSEASVTFLQEFNGMYFFYYDTFINDSIHQSRSIDYTLDELETSTGQPFDTHEDLQDWIDENLGAPSASSITDYRSDFDESSYYIYSGYNKNGTPFIIRYIAGVVTTAENVTNLTTDWDNRTNLIYI